MIYTVQNKYTNEIFKFKKLEDIAEKINCSLSTICHKFQKNRNNIEYKNWILSKLDGELDDSLPKRTLEGNIRDILSPEQYNEFINRRDKKRKIYKWLVEESFKDENILSEINKKKEWEKHLESCCTSSFDKKTMIPNSLLNDFPELIYMSYPKSMT